eukprot:3706050-Prorocentrum_lima.AAC.1
MVRTFPGLSVEGALPQKSIWSSCTPSVKKESMASVLRDVCSKWKGPPAGCVMRQYRQHPSTTMACGVWPSRMQ